MRQNEQGYKKLEQRYEPTRPADVTRAPHPARKADTASQTHTQVSRVNHALGHGTRVSKE